ncbi:MAG: DUF4129 domain-containing protein [Actinomycetota bacterium]|nr:DUF4129 domain-containing protein [Actinomycetota bacterium]
MAENHTGRDPLGAGGPGRVRAVAWVSLALLAVVGAAVAVPEHLSLEPGERDRLVLPVAPSALKYLTAVLGLLVLLSLVVFRIAILKTDEEDRVKRWSPWRFVALFLVGAALWATFAMWRQNQIVQENSTKDPTVLPSPGRREAPGEDRGPRREYSESLGYAVTVLFGLGIVALVIFGVIVLRRDPGTTRRRRAPGGLRKTVEESLEDLRTIADPRAAVIACYSRMETVVELAGVPHRLSDTPFELLGRVLEHHDVAADSARRLTELFEEAKFSLRVIDEPMRQEAMNALLDVRDQLYATSDLVMS